MKSFELKMKYFVVGFVFLVTQATIASPIYNSANGHYYENISVSVDWQTAMQQAETRSYNGLGGHLVTITSQLEQDFIEDNISLSGNTWLGGFQPMGSPEPDGNWQWVTGEAWSYSNWYSAEPNNLNGQEQYLEMRYHLHDTWNDTKLSQANDYLVEYDDYDPTVYNPDNGHYYEPVYNAVDWETARTEAESRSYHGLAGHLATITSQSEQDFIEGNITFTDAAWLGGFQPDGSPEPDGNWQWITGEAWGYTNWRSGEPNNNGQEQYLEMYSSDYSWNDLDGTNQHYYLVEYVPEPATVLMLLFGLIGMVRKRKNC